MPNTLVFILINRLTQAPYRQLIRKLTIHAEEQSRHKHSSLAHTQPPENTELSAWSKHRELSTPTLPLHDENHLFPNIDDHGEGVHGHLLHMSSPCR